MTLRSIVWALFSLALGTALIALLFAVSHVHWKDVLTQWGTIDRLACLWLAALLATNSFLSAWKWRLTDRAMRRESDGLPSLFESFALTSIGSALGQILPVQLSMPAARTLGTRIHGRPFQRGMLATLFELSFDVLFSGFLMLASLVILLSHGGEKSWLVAACAAALLAILLGGGMLAVGRHLLEKLVPEVEHPSRWRRFAIELKNSELLEASLGRKLMALSGLRFIVFVLIAGEVTEAIHANIPLWHLAVAMPFTVLATAAAITPGGLGLTEFTYAGVLRALGTPFAIAAQWAVASRLLVFSGSIVVAILLLPFFLALRAAGETEIEPQAPSAIRRLL